MSRIRILIDTKAETPAEMETILNRLETDEDAPDPYEIVGVGCRFTAPDSGEIENIYEGVPSFNAHKLGRLKLVQVPTGVAGNSTKFFEFVTPFIHNHKILSHSLMTFAGNADSVLLMRAALEPEGPALNGDGTWGWSAMIEGDDIVVKNATVTAFGGANDPDDNGETASGFPTKGNPHFQGCSLPFAYAGSDPKARAALGGSPIPKMPYGVFSNGTINPNGAHVEVSDPASGRSLTVPVIDRGPAKNSLDPRPLDLTVAAAKFFDPSASVTNFKRKLDIRIINGVRLAGLSTIVGTQDDFPGTLAKLALTQYQNFKNFRETDPPLSSQIQKYWSEIGLGFTSVSTPWSAVFISWLVKQAGASKTAFKFSAMHSNFVYWSIKERNLPDRAFAGHPIEAYKVKIGDIIHHNRAGGQRTFDYAAKHPSYLSHSAIVVELNEDADGPYALTIGGNEGDSVGRRKVRLNPNGTVRQRDLSPYISVLESRKLG